MNKGTIVSYDGAPHNSGYKYLVDIGYHNGIINLRTYSPIPKPLKINGGLTATPDEALAMVVKIHRQFPHEANHYEFQSEQTFD